MRSRWVLGSVAAVVALASCGSSAGRAGDVPATRPSSPVASTTTPPSGSGSTAASRAVGAPALPVDVVDGAGRSVVVESIDRIVPLDGDLAEIVFALGLGDRVVATDLSATYPPEADALPQIGYQRALSAEPILAFEPTVLLATPAAGPAEVLDQLRDVVPLVVVDAPPDLDGPPAKIRAVATALGVPGRGEALARTVEEDIATALADVSAGERPPVVAALYLRGERVQQVFGPGSTVHALLEALGAIDVGERLGVVDNAAITAEAMIDARPEVLVVTTTGLASVGGIDGLLALPAFVRSPAAASRRVLAFEDQYLYGFGPRTGSLLRELAAGLYDDDLPATATSVP